MADMRQFLIHTKGRKPTILIFTPSIQVSVLFTQQAKALVEAGKIVPVNLSMAVTEDQAQKVLQTSTIDYVFMYPKIRPLRGWIIKNMCLQGNNNCIPHIKKFHSRNVYCLTDKQTPYSSATLQGLRMENVFEAMCNWFGLMVSEETTTRKD